MTEKRIYNIFPELPKQIELVVYEYETPTYNMDAHVAQKANIFDPHTDVWIQLLHVPPNLRNGSKGIHYGTEIVTGLIDRYTKSDEYINKVRRICFSLAPRDPNDDDYVRNFYKKFGFKFNTEIPGYEFGYLNFP